MELRAPGNAELQLRILNQMLRRLFTFLSVISLLLCVAAIVFWIRNARRASGTEDEVSFLDPWNGDRLTLRCESGRTVLVGPPRLPANFTPTRTADGQTAEMLVAKQVDTEMDWKFPVGLNQTFGPRPPSGQLLAGYTYYRAPTDPPFQPVEMIPPLMRALEQPKGFISAHTSLASVTGKACTSWLRPMSPEESFDETSYYPQPEWNTSGKMHVTCVGMKVVLSRDPSEGKKVDELADHELRFGWVVSADPAQFSALRREWHRRLDVEMVSGAHWMLVVGTGVLPAAWLLMSIRGPSARRRQRPMSRCRACGYDLRATPERCPECGTVATVSRQAGATIDSTPTQESLSAS